MRDKNTARGVFICLSVIVIALLIILFSPVKASAAYGVTTARQDYLHEAADTLRALGYSDDSDVIKALSAAWKEEADALDIIAKVMKNEAPGTPDAQWCPLWHQATVGQIIVNRVNDPRFQENTVREVVSAPKQYSLAYCSNFDGIEQHYYEMARLVMDGEAAALYEIPSDVIYHDNQAHGPIWKTSYINTGHFASTTYFCR